MRTYRTIRSYFGWCINLGRLWNFIESNMMNFNGFQIAYLTLIIIIVWILKPLVILKVPFLIIYHIVLRSNLENKMRLINDIQILWLVIYLLNGFASHNKYSSICSFFELLAILLLIGRGPSRNYLILNNHIILVVYDVITLLSHKSYAIFISRQMKFN